MLQEYKLSENEIKENSVEGSKIYWKGDAVALQRLFDRLGKFLIGRYNGVIDLLDTSGITEKVNGANIKSIRLNDDKIMEYSLDGKVFEATGSSGHIIIDEIGNTMPQRSRLHFNNAKVTDDGYLTIVSGVKGEQGSQGVEGPQGIQGIQGIQGLVGSGGPQGIQGIRGERGYIGERGEQGEQGIQGVQGEQGERGLTGAQGVQGVQGIKGDKGVQGETGAAGIITSINGKSAATVGAPN